VSIRYFQHIKMSITPTFFFSAASSAAEKKKEIVYKQSIKSDKTALGKLNFN